MASVVKDFFKEASADLFTNHPKLLSFGWAQYTPYFNDGDVCTFRANTDYPYIKFEGDEGEEEEEFTDYKDEETSPRVKAGRAVKKFLREFEDEDLEHMFGDHVKITVSRDGKVTREGYDHD